MEGQLIPGTNIKDRMKDFEGKSQVLSSNPIFSKVRFSADLTPIATPKVVFGGANAPQNAQLLYAFGYGRDDQSAVKAGFGTLTAATVHHTNLMTGGKLPGDARMQVHRLKVRTVGFVTRPTDTASTETIVNDAEGKQEIALDALLGKDEGGASLHDYVLALIDHSYAPFFSYGESGARTYLGSVRRMLDEGIMFPEGILWDNKGEGAGLRVGFELVRKVKNIAWSETNKEASIMARIATQLNEDNSAAPADTLAAAWIANLDLVVEAHGFNKTLIT